MQRDRYESFRTKNQIVLVCQIFVGSQAYAFLKDLVAGRHACSHFENYFNHRSRRIRHCSSCVRQMLASKHCMYVSTAEMADLCHSKS